MARPVDVIDLSHHNIVTDWQEIRNAGVQWVIHKATEGTSWVDPLFHNRVEAGGNVGIRVVPYHFVRAGNWRTQIDNLLRQAPNARHVALDYEADDAQADELAWIIWELHRQGLQVLLYGSPRGKLLATAQSNPLLGLTTELWVAHYTDPAHLNIPDAWQSYLLWQYTDKGTVPGIDGAVDLSHWNPDRSVPTFLP